MPNLKHLLIDFRRNVWCWLQEKVYPVIEYNTRITEDENGDRWLHLRLPDGSEMREQIHAHVRSTGEKVRHVVLDLRADGTYRVIGFYNDVTNKWTALSEDLHRRRSKNPD